MEVIILYGFICSGKSTIAKEYEEKGYTVITYDDDEKNFSANLQKLIKQKEKIIIDAPIWNVQSLTVHSALCGYYMVYPTNVKVHVLPHLELDEVLSRVKNRWVSNPEHVNHKQYEEDLEWCLKDIEFRYLKEYKQQNLITEI